MDAALQNIIKKVQRLRALSNSSNAHEAAAAAAAADRLIQQYRIEEAALEGAEAEMAADVPLCAFRKRPGWIRYLVVGLCRHYDVVSVYVRRADSRMEARLWGHQSDVELTIEMYNFVVDQISVLSGFVAGASNRRSFRMGAAFGVLQAMAEAKARVMHGHGAIVLAGRAAAALARVTQHYPNVKQAGRVPALPADGQAFARGLAAGRKIPGEKNKRLGEDAKN